MDRQTRHPWKPVGPPDATDEWVGHDASERFPIYTRGNAGEVYPEVFTPLSFSVAAEAAERAMRNAMLGTGLVRPEELGDLPITTAVGSGVFGGYAYLNLSIQRLMSARVPGGTATDADRNYLGMGDPPPHVPDPAERNLRATLAGARHLWTVVRRTELPELEHDRALVDRFLSELADPATGTDDELRASTDRLIPLFAELFQRHLEVSLAAGLAVALLTALCERQLGDPLLAVRLLGGLGDVDSAAPSVALWDLSRVVAASPTLTEAFEAGTDGILDRLPDDPDADDFRARFATFLERFGSRGPNEWDSAFDTWETDPSLALTLIDRLRGAEEHHDPRAQQQRMATEAGELEVESQAQLPRPLRPLFRAVLRSARLHSRARERSKTTVVRAIHGGRVRTMELDRRLVERSGGQRGDLWFLLEDEADGYLADPGAYRELIADRRAQHARLAERVPPFFFSGAQPPLDEWERRDSTVAPLPAGATLTGLPGCPGRASGTARVVIDPSDPRGLAPGEVLVAPLTDPSWTPLFLAAEAVVVDVGAVMSHAVIVSRELGIPCVVAATDATRRIPDGAEIEVDGTAGTVTVRR